MNTYQQSEEHSKQQNKAYSKEKLYKKYKAYLIMFVVILVIVSLVTILELVYKSSLSMIKPNA